MDSSDLKILAIDDHEDNLMALKAVLADAFPKAQVLTALNGREGIELAPAQDPDVILLDLVMPEMDGYEVCRTLKGDDRLRSIPVVILTALKTDRESRIKALEEGAEAFLSKPFDEAELIAQVRAMAKIKAASERQRQEAQRLAVLVAERTEELRKELAERRKAEQELQQANQQLRRSQAAMLNLLEDLRREVDLRKRSEEEIRRQADRAESYLNVAAVMMVAIKPSQKTVLVNRKTCEVLGCEEKDILSKNWFDTFLPEKDRDRIKAGFNDLIAGKIEPWEYVESRLLTACGEEKLIAWRNTVLRDDSGRIIATLSSGEDITERRRLEETLRERTVIAQTFMDALPCVALLLKPGTREIVALNKAAREAGARLGATCFGSWPKFDKACWFCRAPQAWETGTPQTLEVEALGIFWEAHWVPVTEELYLHYALDITERKQAEEKRQAHQWQLRELASELSLAEERERRRIALALHDHTCQSLVLARMKIQEQLAAMSAGQAEAFRGVCGVLSDTIEGVRELTFDLSSPTLYRFGLEAALEELLEDKFGAAQDVQYDFSDDGEPKPLTDDVRVLLFQSVREILINVLKHARARNITLDIRRADGSIRIAVTDDGVGFDVDEVSSLPTRYRGFGLFSIKERLDCIGGAFEIDSQRGVGSRFILVAPLKVEGQDSGRKHDVGQDSARG